MVLVTFWSTNPVIANADRFIQGVDNALEISVVLSTGEYLITNAYRNPDLFWALRGGGGSTYGIVTSVTYRTYPSVPVQAWSFQANITNSSVLPELVEGLLRYQTQFTDDGWGGYGSISDQGINFVYFAPNMTNETVTTTTEAWQTFAQSLAPYGVVSASDTYYYASWYDLFYQIMFSGAVENGGYVIISSRLLSRETVASNYTQVAPLLIECSAGFKYVPIVCTLFGLADRDPRSTIAGGRVSQFSADSAGLNPAWRNAVVETVCGVSWDEDTPTTDIQRMIQQLRAGIQAMYDVTPNDGAYLNEVCRSGRVVKRFGSHPRVRIGVPVRGRLAEDVFRCTLFDVEAHQGQLRSVSVVCRCGGDRVRGLE